MSLIFLKVLFAYLTQPKLVTLTALIPLSSVISPSILANDKSSGTSLNANEFPNDYFESRLPLNKLGKPDLTPLSQCSPENQVITTPLLQPEFKTKESNSLSRWFLSAQSSPEISRQRTHLIGQVSLKDKESRITAEEVVLDHQLQQVTATGGISVESEKAYFGSDSLIQSADKKIAMKNANFYFFENHANGSAEKIQVDVTKQHTELSNLTFSTCPVGEDGWQFATSEMNIDQEKGWGEAWNTTLRVGGVPVFYFPYINFPVDEKRKSGLLPPSINNSDKNGLDTTLPVYWNISPSMDATFSPRQIQKRGFQLGSELRWMTQNSYSQLQINWLEKDKLIQKALNSGSVTTSNSAERWQSKLNYQARLNDFWRMKIDTHRVSDSDYFRDFGAGLEASNKTQLTSQANLSYSDDIWQANLFAISYQSLSSSESYRSLPGLNIRANYLSENGFQWQLDTQWQQFEHPDINQIEASRLNIKPSLSYPMKQVWGFFNPKMSFQSTQYVQKYRLNEETNERRKNQNLTRNLPIFSLDSGLFFDRKLSWSNGSYTHSLIPRLFYSYIPHKRQDEINLFDTTESSFNFNQLWKANRFSGVDRIGDTNHVSLGLNNTLIKDQSGKKIFSINLGKKYYLKDRFVQLQDEVLEDTSSSSWLTDLSWRINPTTQIEYFVEWDQQKQNTNQARTKIKFEPLPNHIVNVSHRYRSLITKMVNQQSNEEADFSYAWSLNDRWRMVGRWYYDLQRNQTIEALAGIEYESCCWAVRLVAQKYLNIQLNSAGQPITISNNLTSSAQYSDGIHLQFVFKGLGSAGQSGVSEMLESSIASYRDPFLN